jgi:hypothetical protein
VTDRLQNLLVLLILGAAAALLFVSTRGPQGSSPAEEWDLATTATATTATATTATATTATATTATATTATATTATATSSQPVADRERQTEDSSQDARQSTAPTPSSSPSEPSLAQVFAGVGEEGVAVLVLGDDTSNTRSEWVHEWGLIAAERRPTTVVHWDEMGDVSYVEPDLLREGGDGVPLTIWSASRTGADIPAATDRLDLFVPDDEEIDAVIVNLGVNDTVDGVEQDLDALLAGLRSTTGDAPIGVVRQGSQGSDDGVADAVVRWSQENDLTVLDAGGTDGPSEWARAIHDAIVP